MDKPPGNDRPQQRFIADCMLGKLAKWLRLIGFDTVYIHDAADDELARLVVREDRILLTKDRLLAERRMVRNRSVFITEEGTAAQLRQVIHNLDLNVDESCFFTRCLVCNSDVQDVPKSSVRSSVPPYVYETQTQFGKCTGCGRIYWRGTHVEHALEALAEREL